MPAYATISDLEAYVEGLDVALADEPRYNRELERASRDVDNYVGGASPLLESGWRFDPLTLTAVESAALARATAAQTEYRLIKGPDFFVDQGATVQGPDFTITGSNRWFSPKAARELRLVGMIIGGARAKP